MFSLRAYRPFLAAALGIVCGTSFFAGPSFAQVGSVIQDFKHSAKSGNLPFTPEAYDVFGSSLAPLGDLDGDGNPELLVGAPKTGILLPSATGAVFVLSLLPDGSVLGSVEIAEGLNGFTGDLDGEDSFGYAVAAIGDVNGDGVTDIAVSAPEDDDGQINDLGAVWILFLRTDGTVLSHQKISSTQGGLIGSIPLLLRFGAALAGVGDLDGDGIPDLAVGGPPQFSGGSSFPEVWLLRLNADGTVKAENRINAASPALTSQVFTGDAFGHSLLALGDFDGDGTLNLCVGNPSSSLVEPGAGVVHLLELDSTGEPLESTLIDISDVPAAAGFTRPKFGNSLAHLGDLDGDGVLELAAGITPGKPSGGPLSEDVFIFSLHADGTTSNFHLISPPLDSVLKMPQPGDIFGAALAGLGDLNGDGTPDLAVGAPGSDDDDTNTGALHLLLLSDGDPVADFTYPVASDCAPYTVSFTDTSPSLGITSRFWYFGDGSTSTDQNPTHVYTTPGTYLVALKVISSGGTGRKVVRDAVVVLGAPSVRFSASRTLELPLRDVVFTDESSAGVTAWAWDFGDGSTSTGQNPIHSYFAPGTYDVSLTATCDSGSGTLTKPGYIVVVDGPEASVLASNGSGINPDVLASLVDPELGVTWQGQVDGSSIGATGLSFFIAYGSGLPPGIVTSFGELLVDPNSDFIALHTGSFVNGTAIHALPVPNDIQLVGFTFSGQDFLNNVGGSGQLTNRLDFILGL